MKDLFLLVSNKIKEVPVRWVDFDMGQLEQEFPPVSFPCALVSFSNASYQELGAGSEIAEVIIDVRLAFKVFERTHSQTAITPTDFRNKGLEHLDIIDQVHAVLNGLSAVDIGSLSRTSYIHEKRADLRVYRLSYKSQITTTPETPTYIPPNEHTPGTTVGFCNEVFVEPLINT